MTLPADHSAEDAYRHAIGCAREFYAETARNLEMAGELTETERTDALAECARKQELLNQHEALLNGLTEPLQGVEATLMRKMALRLMESIT